MFGFDILSLPREEFGRFYLDNKRIYKLRKELNELDSKLNKYNSNKLFLIPENIMIFKDINLYNKNEVKSIIDNMDCSSNDKIRYYNLYLANLFINSNVEITPDNLKKLYNIISSDLVDYDDKSMGEYYRKTHEYISNNRDGMFLDFTEVVKPLNVDKFMSSLFEYINSNNSENELDIFIKSQIIHLYLVYVHPYLDCNGRTAREIASWYLMNNGLSKYLLFNNATSNDRYGYIDAVKKSISTSNVSYYLEFIMNGLKNELNKQLIIDRIDNDLSIIEMQIIDAYLTLGDNSTIDELLFKINNYDVHRKNNTYIDSIMLLVEKGIFILENNCLKLNNDIIDLGGIYGSREDRKSNKKH